MVIFVFNMELEWCWIIRQARLRIIVVPSMLVNVVPPIFQYANIHWFIERATHMLTSYTIDELPFNKTKGWRAADPIIVAEHGSGRNYSGNCRWLSRGFRLDTAFGFRIDAIWSSWLVTDVDRLQLTLDWLHTYQCSHLLQ